MKQCRYCSQRRYVSNSLCKSCFWNVCKTCVEDAKHCNECSVLLCDCVKPGSCSDFECAGQKYCNVHLTRVPKNGTYCTIHVKKCLNSGYYYPSSLEHRCFKRYCEGELSQIKYIGRIVSGVPHGYGIQRTQDKNSDIVRYEGNWNKGLKEGKGKEFYQDESYYEGYWIDNKKQGIGILYSSTMNLNQRYDNGILVFETQKHDVIDKFGETMLLNVERDIRESFLRNYEIQLSGLIEETADQRLQLENEKIKFEKYRIQEMKKISRHHERAAKKIEDKISAYVEEEGIKMDSLREEYELQKSSILESLKSYQIETENAIQTRKEISEVQLQELLDEYEAQKFELLNEIVLMQSNKVEFDQIILLDIGGKMFKTSLQTLQKYPDSFFGIMFSGRHVPIKQTAHISSTENLNYSLTFSISSETAQSTLKTT